MKPPQIEQDQLHIWWAKLRDFDADVPILRSVLSPSEQARAGRFRFLRDKNNYIISHGILRMLLGIYLGRSGASLNFTFGPYGKPELSSDSCGGTIHFNISHSEDLALYGVTGACPIGVDVEYLQPIPDCERIAPELFSQEEAQGLLALPKAIRERHFFDLWTRKEALLKAKGDGLGSRQPIRDVPLSQALDFSDDSRTLRTSANCCVHSFSPLPGYVAAAAFRKPNLNLVYCGAPDFFLQKLCDSRRPLFRSPGT